MKYVRRYGGGESKSFHTAFSESINDLKDCDENEMIVESLTLETENEKRHRLDSFYSATSAKSTYFSTGSVSSYHSVDDSDSAEIGMLLIVHASIELNNARANVHCPAKAWRTSVAVKLCTDHRLLFRR